MYAVGFFATGIFCLVCLASLLVGVSLEGLFNFSCILHKELNFRGVHFQK